MISDVTRLDADPDGTIGERLSAVLDASAEAVVIVDAGEQIIFANSEVERLLGWHRSELLGESLEWLIPGGFWESEPLAERREGCEHGSWPVKAVVVCARCKDGKETHVEATVSPMNAWRQGARAVSMRDATERLEGERALRESEERFRLISQTSRDVLYEWDAEHGTVWIGDALTQIYGYAPNQIVRGNPWWLAHVHPDDLERVRQRTDELWASDATTWSAEYRFRRADGSYADVFDRCAMVRNAAGLVTRAVGAVMDISERRRAEAKQRDLEREQARLAGRLQLLLDRMPMACILYDGSFNITFWNAAAQEIFGWTREEVLGKNPLDVLVPAESREFVVAAMDGMSRGAWGERNENVNVTKDGKTITCEWHNTAIFDEQGVFVGALAMAQDITSRRALEQQLLHAQKMDGIGRLAGGVAHDFNNLLTAILGNAAMVRNSLAPDDPRVVDLDQIRSASLRAADLTQQLLSFARRKVVTPRVVELNRAVLRTDRLLRRLLGEDIEITTLPSPEAVRIRIDPAQLEQLIINLAVNARDAMSGGGTLTIGVSVVDSTDDEQLRCLGTDPCRYALLTVQDTGTGIDPDVMPRIFEPFFTTKEPDRGTGLGLSICYGVVQQAGGVVRATSRIGEGTTIAVLLPATDERELDEPTSTENLPRRGSETILVVEDEPRILRMLTHALRESGYRVLAAESGMQAIDVAARHPGTIDLLVADLVMPKMSGRSLARELSSRGLVTRVLFVSGYVDEDSVRIGLEDPNVQLLEKPFTGYDVALKVRQFLDSQTAAR